MCNHINITRGNSSAILLLWGIPQCFMHAHIIIMCVCLINRYSAVRRQFGPTPDQELPILEYQLQVATCVHIVCMYTYERLCRMLCMVYMCVHCVCTFVCVRACVCMFAYMCMNWNKRVGNALSCKKRDVNKSDLLWQKGAKLNVQGLNLHTVKPLNNGHLGTSYIYYTEVVLFQR